MPAESGDDAASVNGPVRVGCVYRPQLAPERLASVARKADEAGVSELWLWEDCFLSGGISAAAIALSHSNRLTVGVGVLPIPMRNVALTAMEIATLSRAFPGRVRIGVGHGVQDWMQQIGERVESPVTLLREYLGCLKLLLRGQRVSFDGRYVSLDDVGLDWPPVDDAEMLCAAQGPRTLALSGELADGTIISSGTSPDALRAAREHIATGQAAGGRTQPHAVVAYLVCTTGPDADAKAAEEISHWGYDADADVAVSGDAKAISEGMRRWFAAGAGTVVLQPTADADMDQFLDMVGTEIRPMFDADDPLLR
jgi:alkanesulfonate monooxygenase SsuD/methylene tetrahydromethanopterin reductase-like flavin-dependent oxidoreductase (luciferase family)